MNTPTHIILSYTFLRTKAREKFDFWWIFLGAVLPDMMIYVLFLYALTFSIPMQEVWDVLYFTPFWQDSTDIFNSVPIILGFMLLAWILHFRGGLLLGASMLIHVLGDIFLHNDDAHRHFFPLSEYKFISPVSYWDPEHHGSLGSFIEILIVICCSLLIYRGIQKKRYKILLISYTLLSSCTFVYFLLR